MSIILGAIGGAGDAMSNIGQMGMKDEFAQQEEQRRFAQQQQMAQLNSQIQEQAQRNLLDYKTQLADTERTKQASRIGDAQQGILDQAMVDKANATTDYTDPDTGESSPVKSVDEIPDEDRAALAPRDQDKLKAYVQAAIKTGDIDPKDAASVYKAGEADLTKLMLADQRADTMKQIAAGHDDTKQLVAGIYSAAKTDAASTAASARTQAASIAAEARKDRQATQKDQDKGIKLDFLRGFDREINQNESEVKSLRGTLKDPLLEPDKQKEIQSQITDLQSQNKNLSDAKIEYARSLGIDVPSVLDNKGRGKQANDTPAPVEPPKPVPAATKRPPLSDFDR